jgi:hypothetical protein
MAIERLNKLGGRGDVQQAQSIIQEGMNEGGAEGDDDDGDGDGEEESKGNEQAVLAALESSASEIILPKNSSAHLTEGTAMVASTSSGSIHRHSDDGGAPGAPVIATEEAGPGEGGGQGGGEGEETRVAEVELVVDETPAEMGEEA